MWWWWSNVNNFIDPNTLESIGLDYVLNKINTLTPYGRELKDNIKPYKIGEESLLIKELNIIDNLVRLIKENKFFFKNIRRILEEAKDIRKSILRAREGFILSNVELFEIKGFMLSLSALNKELKIIEKDIDESIFVSRIVEIEKILDPQNSRIKAFYIYDEYSEKLSEIRKEKKAIDIEIKKVKKEIREKIEKELNIKLRPDGSVVLSKANKEAIEKIEQNQYLAYSSETYLDIKFSFKPTPTILKLEEKLAATKEKEGEEEQKIRKALSQKIGQYYDEIMRNIKALRKLDFILAKAYMAIDTDSIKPKILNQHLVNIKNGRHLKVEDTLKSQGQKFTPISIELREGVACITGANMGGKTVTLKLIGLLCAMAQYGLFVPCKEMEFGLLDFIHGSIGDMQSIDKGLSTFGSEISNIKEAIKCSQKKGLILIDELARGTNPEEGYAISKAIINYLKDKNSITLITTHYDNIANSDNITHYQVIGLSEIDYDELRSRMYSETNNMELISQYMDYRLKKVTKYNKVPRDALNIARLMGLDENIIENAEIILNEKSDRT